MNETTILFHITSGRRKAFDAHMATFLLMRYGTHWQAVPEVEHEKADIPPVIVPRTILEDRLEALKPKPAEKTAAQFRAEKIEAERQRRASFKKIRGAS